MEQEVHCGLASTAWKKNYCWEHKVLSQLESAARNKTNHL